MRTAVLIRASLATAAAAAMVTGCTSTTDGAATGTAAPASVKQAEVFNPCAELPDHVLREVGLDPSTKTVTTDPPDGPSSWRVCGWMTPDQLILVDVFSTSHTLDEARSNEDMVQKVETTIGSRPAIRAYDKSESDGRSCYVSMQAEQGMFEIKAGWLAANGWTRDICEISTEYANALEPHLPR